MKNIKSLLLSTFAGVLFAGSALAAGGGDLPFQANIQPDNLKSLQNGAKLYVNYCYGCHSLEFQRYQRLVDDLQIPKEVVIENLMFTGDKIGDQMKIAMRKEDAAKWFGAAPPDLSLVARSRGVDWLFSYLKGFYKDEKRPYGYNNLVFPSVGMPHVLEGLQGVQGAVFDEHPCADDASKTCKSFAKFEQLAPGSLSAAEYDEAARDIVNFLHYVGEPDKADRIRTGVFVILFLLGLFALAYLLKKEYWKDVYPNGH